MHKAIYIYFLTTQWKHDPWTVWWLRWTLLRQLASVNSSKFSCVFKWWYIFLWREMFPLICSPGYSASYAIQPPLFQSKGLKEMCRIKHLEHVLTMITFSNYWMTSMVSWHLGDTKFSTDITRSPSKCRNFLRKCLFILTLTSVR